MSQMRVGRTDRLTPRNLLFKVPSHLSAQGIVVELLMDWLTLETLVFNVPTQVP